MSVLQYFGFSLEARWKIKQKEKLHFLADRTVSHPSLSLPQGKKRECTIPLLALLHFNAGEKRGLLQLVFRFLHTKENVYRLPK